MEMTPVVSPPPPPPSRAGKPKATVTPNNKGVYLCLIKAEGICLLIKISCKVSHQPWMVDV